ncbi:MAG: peptidoglycan DD-metalloendopeptidase family protein [Paracoccaceae bacterium]
MTPRIYARVNSAFKRYCPEQRLFLKSDAGTRFIRLRPITIATVIGGSGIFVAWTILVTSIFLIDTISSGNAREQAQRERALFEARLNALSSERDERAAEARAAQERFNVALAEISKMQSELLQSEDKRKELETGIEVIQTTLRRTMNERDDAKELGSVLQAQLDADAAENAPEIERAKTLGNSVAFLTAALQKTATERDQRTREASDAKKQADELLFALELGKDRNDKIFSRLEDAVTVSLAPLDKLFSAAGIPTDSLLREVRRGYSGQGGPLRPIVKSTSGEDSEIDGDSARANEIMNGLDKINMFRIAAEQMPLDMPVKSAYRFTSGYGYRNDPKSGGRRMHKGADFAGRTGTPILSAGDGVVTYAGWQSGYGRLIKIQHAFGFETRYAHLSKIDVKKGQRVSRGDRIGDMGASGRVTGTHLHYEIRNNGNAVNPMTYIKAGRDVF